MPLYQDNFVARLASDMRYERALQVRERRRIVPTALLRARACHASCVVQQKTLSPL